jgi:DnaK suppressor protein
VKINPDSELTAGQMETLRTKLERARQDIFERARRRRPSTDGDPLEQGGAAGDPADQAEATFEQSLSAHLNESDRRRLQDINAALERMDEGTYGLCLGSGDPIGFDRLNVEPWARYSLAYQELAEAASGNGPPPSL